MAKRNKSAFPMGSEFSPNQLSLKTVLELAHECNGNKVNFDQEIHSEVMSKKTFKTSQNCRLSMIQYQIIDENTKLTEIGQSLYDARNDEKELYVRLAKHILENLNGYNLVNTIRELDNGGEIITLTLLARRLQEKGLYVPDTGTHLSKMKLWLEQAGIFSGWSVNESALQDLTGASTEDSKLLKSLTVNQRAFLSSLAVLGSGASKEIAEHAVMTRQIQYKPKSLSNDIVNPLEKKGLINIEKKSGRSTLITPTKKMEREVILTLLKSLEKEINSDLHIFLEKTLEQVLEDIESDDKHIKGLALEALGIRLMSSINLKYIETRLRGTSTGGAEVDLLFESIGSQQLFFSRWQIQCKNTKNVSLDDVAKEVGLTISLKSNVIVMITTGKIGVSARNYSKSVMSTSNLVVILIDGNDLQKLKDDLGYMRLILERETGIASAVKLLPLNR
jgi:hypothetical protein